MELWVKIGDEKKKYQGAFGKVMGDLWRDAKEKGGPVQLLSIHSHKKELRRFKREMREHEGNLVEVAKCIAVWFLQKDMRKIRRKIKELKALARYTNSKGEVKFKKGAMRVVGELEEKLRKIEEEIKQFEGGG